MAAGAWALLVIGLVAAAVVVVRALQAGAHEEASREAARISAIRRAEAAAWARRRQAVETRARLRARDAARAAGRSHDAPPAV